MTDVADIIQEARVLLDLNPQGETCGDTLSVDRILRGRLTQALSEVLAEAPLSLLGAGTALQGEVSWHRLGEKWWGSIPLPEDFLRLIVFEMSDWAGPARLISVDDAEYARQRNPYRGVGGCPQRPVVAVAPADTGLCLEFYASACPCAKVARARYLPMPNPDSDSIDLSPLLADKVAIRLAQLAANILKIDWQG